MKKRSLVAALAMLMVSAIVLTSSTYAWFATSTTAQVSGLNATIKNDKGSIYVSSDKLEWKSSLSSSDFNGFTQNLTPVSYNPTIGDYGTFYTGAFDAAATTEFKLNGTEAISGFNKFTIYLKSEQAGQVKVSPALAGEMSNGKFVYASVKVNGSQVFLGSSGDSYYPIYPTSQGQSGTAYDTAPQNGVIDAAELVGDNTYGCALGNQVAVSTSTDLIVDINAYVSEADVVEVIFYLWAEGQDTDCFGVRTASPTFKIDFEYKTSFSA